ncbi:MAG: vitamin K epoxide reductase family protein [Chloroflexota bacterium]
MKRNIIPFTLLLIGLLVLPISSAQAQSGPPVVRAVLFYSPTCGHCQKVISETLLPMVDHYGDQLQIIGLDITQPKGWELFVAALQKFGMDRTAVPFLVVDNICLVGSVEIPERFPGLVEGYLAQGGVDWPDLPGLADILPTPAETAAATRTASPLATPAPVSVTPASSSPSSAPAFGLTDDDDSTWRERFVYDPAGNTLAVIVLAGMIGSLAWAFIQFKNAKGRSLKDEWNWAIPLLCVIGSAVAAYLAYVETAEVTAVCGPVGDCNTVQQSEYASLFGVLPIGVLGLVGYAAIAAAWLVARYADGRLASLGNIALFGMTVIGTLFSIYLTFLEPFVIGATCAWCLTSALVMTGLMLLSVGPGRLALKEFTANAEAVSAIT